MSWSGLVEYDSDAFDACVHGWMPIRECMPKTCVANTRYCSRWYLALLDVQCTVVPLESNLERRCSFQKFGRRVFERVNRIKSHHLKNGQDTARHSCTFVTQQRVHFTLCPPSRASRACLPRRASKILQVLQFTAATCIHSRAHNTWLDSLRTP